jgi:hypothetical protein
MGPENVYFLFLACCPLFVDFETRIARDESGVLFLAGSQNMSRNSLELAMIRIRSRPR